MVLFAAVALHFPNGTLNVRGTVRRFRDLLERDLMLKRMGIESRAHIVEVQTMSIDFDRYVEMVDGKPSVPETLKKFERELREWDRDRRLGQQQYLDALVQVLGEERSPVARMGAIASAFALLGLPPSKWTDALGKFESAINTNPGMFRQDRGRYGGLSLIQAPEQPKRFGVSDDLSEADDAEEYDEEEEYEEEEPEPEPEPEPPPVRRGRPKKVSAKTRR